MATPPSSVQGRPARALAPALLLGTALVVAAAVIHSQLADGFPDGTNAAIRRHRRSTFLWISVSILLVGCTLFWIVRSSTRVRAGIVKWKLADRMPVGAVLYCALSTLALAIGVYGVWTCSGSADHADPDLRPQLHPEPRWPTVATTAVAAAWLAGAMALLGMGVVSAVRDIRPGQETPPALMLLRCSCCSPVAQRAVLALPFTALATISGVLWHGTRTNSATCAAARESAQLLLGSTVVFGSIVVALAVATAAAVWLHKRASGPVTHARRRACHALVLFVVVGFGAAAIAWAIKSWRWLRAHDPSDALLASCAVDARAVRFTTGALFTSGVLLLALTGCCRLERHLLPTAATPHVDMSMLSPHAIRPPALTKSPEPHDAV